MPALQQNARDPQVTLDQAQLRHGSALFDQFRDGRVDLATAEFIDWQTLDDLPLAAVRADREGTHDPWLHPIAAVRADCHAGPVARRGRRDEGAHRIDGRIGGGGRGGKAACLDDGRTPLLDGADEVALEPGAIRDDFGGGFAADLGIVKVREHRAAVVAPDAQIADFRHLHTGLLGQLALRTVFIQARHGEPAIRRHVLGRALGDEAVRIARIANDEDAHIGGRIVLDRLPLAGEDLAVDVEEVFALHASLARHAADQDGPVRTLEALVQIRGRRDAVQEGEGAVIQFHHHTTQGRQGGLDLDQAESDRLVRAKDGARGDAEEEGITDLTGCTGDGD